MANKIDKQTKEIKVKKILGFSEKLVLNVLLASWATILLGVVYAFIFRSETVWVSILDVVKYLAPSTVAFFIWKAKSENMVRIKDNPHFNLQDFIQQTWNEFVQEGDRLDDNNNYY